MTNNQGIYGEDAIETADRIVRDETADILSYFHISGPGIDDDDDETEQELYESVYGPSL